MIEVPSQGRAVIKQEYDSLNIEIPSQKSWPVVIFMMVWLGGWAFGEIFAVGMLFSGDAPLPTTAFILFWLAGWTTGGVFTFYSVLWQLTGREIIRVESGYLTVGRYALRIGRKRVYETGSIKNLETVSGQTLTVPGRREWFNVSARRGGGIKFEYGMKTVRFAADVDDAEAKVIFDRLRHGSFLRSENFTEDTSSGF